MTKTSITRVVPSTKNRKALVAAIAAAEIVAEEDCLLVRIRMREAEGTSGELNGYAVALLNEAWRKSDLSSERVTELENEIVALDEGRRAAAKGILVVSSDPEIRKSTAAALRSTGEPVTTASTTRAGVRKAANARVLVLDLVTAEGIDGEAFREVGAPVVVLSRDQTRPIVIGVDHQSATFTREALHRAVTAAAA
jgi:CheY-like chemotaxis protein